ncbi:MAG: cell envelope integrity protein TolA [Gammaproteobacteria bacterium]|nr:cell envelope integrity protein TolA [Gammaproteobacteria bacterium]
MSVAAVDAARDYAVPLVLALVVHAVALFALAGGMSPEQALRETIKPSMIQARLLNLPSPPPQARPKPVAAQVAPPKPVQEPVRRPKPAVQAKPEPDAKAEAERARAQAERERAERLQALNERSMEAALSEEAAGLADSAIEDAAMDYIYAIHRAVVEQWSRPQSARNDMQARLLVELVPSGDLLAVTLTESSGHAPFDRSAEAAVRKVGRFEVPTDRALFEARFRKFTLLFKPEDLLR